MVYNNVKDFGAIGDGQTKDTAAIQAAIDAGGIVTFPVGTYLTGTIYLRSNGGIDLQPGATLLASPDLDDYNPWDFAPQNGKSIAEVTSGGHLIIGLECENIVLSGCGTIDGNSGAFLNKPLNYPPHMFERIARPAQMIFLCECTGVHITDLNLRNSPYWTCFLWGCEEATLRGLHIHSHEKVLNDDGIDIDCCRRVTISDCIIDTGDDCITLRGNTSRLKIKRPCEYIAVTNCILTSRYANTIRIGVGDGTIRKAVFNNLVLTGYRTGISVVSNWSNNPKSCVGVDIYDVDFTNIRCYARKMLNVKLDNVPNGEAHTAATIHDVTFRGIRGTFELTNSITGNNVGTLRDITLDDVAMTCAGSGPNGGLDFKGAWGHESTDAPIDIANAQNIILRNVDIAYSTDASGWTCDCRATNADVVLKGSDLKLDRR